MAFLAKQTLGDENLALEVLRLFDEMQKTYFARLETSTTVPDLLNHLHTLRGAASGVGAFALAELAKTAEEELRAGKPVNPERIDDLGMAVHEASAFIALQVEAA
jgi:HPt (histidine-containing phosphotransfer) domain-containing protein